MQPNCSRSTNAKLQFLCEIVTFPSQILVYLPTYLINYTKFNTFSCCNINYQAKIDTILHLFLPDSLVLLMKIECDFGYGYENQTGAKSERR